MRIRSIGIAPVLVLVGVVALGLFVACAQTAQPQAKAQRTKITIGYALPSMSFQIPWVAEVGGFFKDEGLDVEGIILEGGGAATTPALLADEVQAIVGGMNEVIMMHLMGKPDIIAIYTTIQGVNFLMIASNDWIKKTGLDLNAPLADRISKMKGATFGAPSLGGTTELYMRLILKQGGLGPGDYEIIRTGGGAGQIGALQTGQIDAFASPAPSTVEAELRGAGRLVFSGPDLEALTNTLSQTLVYITPKFAKENPDTLRKMVRALERARILARDNVDETARLMKIKYPQMADETLRRGIELQQQSVVRAGKMSEKYWQNMGVMMKEVGVSERDLPAKTEGVYWTNEYFD